MPFGDKTGPMGLGPMTGRRLGYCAGYPYPGFVNPRGFGGGRGMAWRRGLGWPWWLVPYSPELPTPKEEKKILEEDLKALKEEMKAIEERLKELEKKK